MIVRLNRPDASNALNTQMGRDLVRFFEDVALDPGGLRCIVVTGTGEKAFLCRRRPEGAPGNDRRSLDAAARHLRADDAGAGSTARCRSLVRSTARLWRRVRDRGLLRFLYAADTARFALTEVTLGIMPGGGGTQTLPRAVGERRAKELILTGKPFTSAQAHDWGFVNEVFLLPDLMRESLATASRIARNAPISVRQAKLSIHRGLQSSLRDGLALEIEAYNRMVPTEDRREGVLAFNEKRPPNFKGR